ncbi:protein TIC 20-v, chloroplastic [Abrus precatorius]|uniref:Protein TIC 20 n=1 Tax=Abrus precatorius TaxID=3816 RepID=A0A8B8JG22_ABRPR|nr:protein TIC 20-v, chloroplastic [Abrus precatorius]
MATSTFLSSVTFGSSTFSHKPLHSTFLHSSTIFILPKKFRKPHQFRSLIVAKSNGNDTADVPDRLISALCYFYPFFDGIQYGKYVITQFYPVQAIVQPLVPAIRVFKSFPLNGFLVFLTLYFVVVRNPNFSRYVRFNTMQAIVLDVLLIFPDLLERGFNPRSGLGLDLMMSLDSTVFLFLLVCLIYGSSSCLLGQLPRLPIVADAADRQVL